MQSNVKSTLLILLCLFTLGILLLCSYVLICSNIQANGDGEVISVLVEEVVTTTTTTNVSKVLYRVINSRKEEDLPDDQISWKSRKLFWNKNR